MRGKPKYLPDSASSRRVSCFQSSPDGLHRQLSGCRQPVVGVFAQGPRAALAPGGEMTPILRKDSLHKQLRPEHQPVRKIPHPAPQKFCPAQFPLSLFGCRRPVLGYPCHFLYLPSHVAAVHATSEPKRSFFMSQTYRTTTQCQQHNVWHYVYYKFYWIIQ